MTERQIAQRVVAVTGGGRGIGLATDPCAGWRAAPRRVGDLDGDLAARRAERSARRSTSRAATRSPRSLHRVESELGPIDVLINNAGVMHVGPFVDEDDAWTRRSST